jgi:hypothetical protein
LLDKKSRESIYATVAVGKGWEKVCAAPLYSRKENKGHGDFHHQADLFAIPSFERHCSYSVNGKSRAQLERKRK